MSFTEYMLPKVRVHRHYKFPIVKEKPVMSYLLFVYLLSVLKLILNFYVVLHLVIGLASPAGKMG